MLAPVVEDKGNFENFKVYRSVDFLKPTVCIYLCKPVVVGNTLRMHYKRAVLPQSRAFYQDWSNGHEKSSRLAQLCTMLKYVNTAVSEDSVGGRIRATFFEFFSHPSHIQKSCCRKKENAPVLHNTTVPDRIDVCNSPSDTTILSRMLATVMFIPQLVTWHTVEIMSRRYESWCGSQDKIWPSMPMNEGWAVGRALIVL